MSIATNTLPSISKRTSTASRVVPAISLTMTRGSPASVFTNELLPALRRPTIAKRTSGTSGCSPALDFSRRSHTVSSKRFDPYPEVALTKSGCPKPSAAASKPSASQLGSSTLLAIGTTFCESPALRINFATRSSSGITPSRASITNKISSASWAAL